MPKPTFKRKIFPTNKYQRIILKTSFLPSLITFGFVVLLIKALHDNLIMVILNQSQSELITFINQWAAVTFLGAWILFIVLLTWVYRASLSLVGCFERIFNEMDEIIDGKRTGEIKVRPSDELGNELTSRINRLIRKSQNHN